MALPVKGKVPSYVHPVSARYQGTLGTLNSNPPDPSIQFHWLHWVHCSKSYARDHAPFSRLCRSTEVHSTSLHLLELHAKCSATENSKTLVDGIIHHPFPADCGDGQEDMDGFHDDKGHSQQQQHLPQCEGLDFDDTMGVEIMVTLVPSHGVIISAV